MASASCAARSGTEVETAQHHDVQQEPRRSHRGQEEERNSHRGQEEERNSHDRDDKLVQRSSAAKVPRRDRRRSRRRFRSRCLPSLSVASSTTDHEPR